MHNVQAFEISINLDYIFGFYCVFQADIVAQSRITFQEKELLQLIHSHLQSKGSLHFPIYSTEKLESMCS